MISYAQGYMLLREAAKEQNWNLNYGGIALMWRGGCIIRSRFLGKIKEAFDKNPQLSNLLLDEFFKHDAERLPGVVAAGVVEGDRIRACRLRRFPRRCRSSTAIAPSVCRRTCCRRSAITSARTPTSASTNRAGSSSTRTGRAAAAEYRRALTTCNGSESRVTEAGRGPAPT